MENDQVAPIFLYDIDIGSSSSNSESHMSMIFSSSSDENDHSTDEDSEDGENADFLFPVFNILVNGRPRIRVQNFVETALAKGDDEFREDFRVTRGVFQGLPGV